MCIRGSRPRSKHPCVPPAVDLAQAVAEGHLPACPLIPGHAVGFFVGFFSVVFFLSLGLSFL